MILLLELDDSEARHLWIQQYCILAVGLHLAPSARTRAHRSEDEAHQA
jgi:hypothetical protein